MPGANRIETAVSAIKIGVRSCRVGPGNFTPSLSQIPDVILSHHPARVIARRLPPCGGLRSAPDCRPRRAVLHLWYSYASPFGPALLVTQDPQRTLTCVGVSPGNEFFGECCLLGTGGRRTP